MWSNLLNGFEFSQLKDVTRMKTKQESNVNEKDVPTYFFDAKVKIKNIIFANVNV